MGGSFIAVFVGCDSEVEHGVFGKIDAAEFAADARTLQEVNEVYALAHWDEQQLATWPADGSVPQSLSECCIACLLYTSDAADE